MILFFALEGHCRCIRIILAILSVKIAAFESFFTQSGRLLSSRNYTGGIATAVGRGSQNGGLFPILRRKADVFFVTSWFKLHKGISLPRMPIALPTTYNMYSNVTQYLQ